VQRIKMGTQRAGQLAHVWADEFTVHVLIGGQLVKTVPSSLNAVFTAGRQQDDQARDGRLVRGAR
jgi:hypothetical protein